MEIQYCFHIIRQMNIQICLLSGIEKDCIGFFRRVPGLLKTL